MDISLHVVCPYSQNSIIDICVVAKNKRKATQVVFCESVRPSVHLCVPYLCWKLSCIAGQSVSILINFISGSRVMGLGIWTISYMVCYGFFEKVSL